MRLVGTMRGGSICARDLHVGFRRPEQERRCLSQTSGNAQEREKGVLHIYFRFGDRPTVRSARYHPDHCYSDANHRKIPSGERSKVGFCPIEFAASGRCGSSGYWAFVLFFQRIRPCNFLSVRSIGCFPAFNNSASKRRRPVCISRPKSNGPRHQLAAFSAPAMARRRDT